MTRTVRLLPALLFAIGLAAPALAQTTITGDWDLTITSPQGTRTAPVSLKQDGDKITGAFKSQAGELPVEGSLTGNTFTLAFTINFQGTPLPIKMNGTVDGESIAGKADFGGFAEGDFSAKRAGASAAAAPAAAAAATSPESSSTAAPSSTATTTSSVGAAGKWDVTLKTQVGEFPITATLTDESGKIAGTVMTQMGEVPVEGTIDGKTLKLSMTAKTPQGDIPIALTGDIDGDSIVNGKAEFGGMGQGEWTAKRKP